MKFFDKLSGWCAGLSTLLVLNYFAQKDYDAALMALMITWWFLVSKYNGSAGRYV